MLKKWTKITDGARTFDPNPSDLAPVTPVERAAVENAMADYGVHSHPRPNDSGAGEGTFCLDLLPKFADRVTAHFPLQRVSTVSGLPF